MLQKSPTFLIEHGKVKFGVPNEILFREVFLKELWGCAHDFRLLLCNYQRDLKELCCLNHFFRYIDHTLIASHMPIVLFLNIAIKDYGFGSKKRSE